MMHYQCLIVDDEIDLAKATCEYFQMFDVSCTWVSNALECIEFLSNNSISVMLLDINLEQDSGFALCKKIRKTADFPILFISARQSDDDVLIALNIGGDDYIKKPYSLSILLAKVKVILKRLDVSSGDTVLEHKYCIGQGEQSGNTCEEQVNPCGHSGKQSKQSGKPGVQSGKMLLHPELMSVCLDGRDIRLKAKEYKLLSYMYNNANRIITKDELFSGVWGNSYFSDGTLNVHIRKLREKIEKNPNEPEYIQTVWGTGYIFKL